MKVSFGISAVVDGLGARVSPPPDGGVVAVMDFSPRPRGLTAYATPQFAEGR
jgi:hypothetical protein